MNPIQLKWFIVYIINLTFLNFTMVGKSGFYLPFTKASERKFGACQNLFYAVHFFCKIGRFQMLIYMPLSVEQLLCDTVNTPMQLQCIMSLNMNVHQMFGLVHSLISLFMRGKTKFYLL